MNVHSITEEASVCIKSHGGSIQRLPDKESYNVEVPPGILASGGYPYDRSFCHFWVYPDGVELTFDVETGAHRMYLDRWHPNHRQYLGNIVDEGRLASLMQK